MGKHDGLPPPRSRRGQGRAEGCGGCLSRAELPGCSPRARGSPVRVSGGESVRRRDRAGAAHGPARGTREGAGWLFPSHQPSWPGAPCLPARPCPAPAPRPPGPAFLAGACGFLPAPGARSWLAAGRGARGEREEASGREGREGASWEEFQPLPRARPPRGPGAPGGRLVRVIARGRLGLWPGGWRSWSAKRTRPPGLRGRPARAAGRPAAPPERPLPPSSPAARRTPGHPLPHLRGPGWGPGVCSSPASRPRLRARCLADLIAQGRTQPPIRGRNLGLEGVK